MTPEEKAERYDEALRRARKLKEDPTSVFYEYSPSEGDTIVDYIFPELKESEDEMIRKEILDCFRAMKQQGCFPSKHKEQYDSWIAWLEKQGEQKSQGKSALEAINEEKADNKFCVKPVDKTVEEYNITGIGSKHAEGKLGEMIKNLKPINERLEQKITSSKEDETSIAVNNPDAYKIGFADGEAHAKEEQWKPSDEQIKHLTYVVYDAKHKNRINTNGYEPYSYLYTLLMQLKRLKG